jgi:hypothetical protein
MKMSSFNFAPLTFALEWEVWVAKGGLQLLTDSEYETLAAAVRREIPTYRIGTDDYQLELRTGPQQSLRGMYQAADTMYETARRVAEQKNWRLFGGAGHPVYFGVSGVHVHLGTLRSAEEAMALKYALLPEIPTLIALYACMPYCYGSLRPQQSYRVANMAFGMCTPALVASADHWFCEWGYDVTARTAEKPTVEVRCLDGALTPRIAAEAAGILAVLANAARPGEAPTAAQFEEYLENRYNAARYGLAATFAVDGKKKSAQEAARELVVRAQKGARRLGGTSGSFAWSQRMAEKGRNQADFLRELWEQTGDPHKLAGRLAAMGADVQGLLEEYLAKAKPGRRQRHWLLRDALEEMIVRDSRLFEMQMQTGMTYRRLVESLHQLATERKVLLREELELGITASRRGA